MVRNALVGLVVAAQLLLGVHSGLNAETAALLRPGVHKVEPGYGKGRAAVPEAEFFASRKGALCHRQIPYRLEQVGLALSVASADAVDVRRELQFLKCDVAEILYDDFL